MSKYCEGCPEASSRDSNCYYSNNINADGKCPCTICIIKPMCLTACDCFHAYYQRYLDLKQGRIE